MAELVDALVLGTSGATRESSSLSFRTSLVNRRTVKLTSLFNTDNNDNIVRVPKIYVEAMRWKFQ